MSFVSNNRALLCDDGVPVLARERPDESCLDVSPEPSTRLSLSPKPQAVRLLQSAIPFGNDSDICAHFKDNKSRVEFCQMHVGLRCIWQIMGREVVLDCLRHCADGLSAIQVMSAALNLCDTLGGPPTLY